MPAAALCGVLLAGIGNGFVIWAQQGIPSGHRRADRDRRAGHRAGSGLGFLQQARADGQALIGTAIALAGVVTIVMHTRSLSVQRSRCTCSR